MGEVSINIEHQQDGNTRYIAALVHARVNEPLNFSIYFILQHSC